MAVKEEPEDGGSGLASTSASVAEAADGAAKSPPAGVGLASRPRKPLERPPPAIILQGILGSDGGNAGNGGRTKLEGEIKSFYAERGFGFISCPKVFDMLRCDVYFTLNEVFDVEASKVEERVRKGAKCSFFFTLNRDSRPQARVVRLQQGAEDDDRPAPHVPRNAKFDQSDAEDQQYTGRIKSFNASQGYGFISCADTYARFNRDVFLHHSQLNGLKVGDEVYFRIFVDKTKADAQAKALDVKAAKLPDTSPASPTTPSEAPLDQQKSPAAANTDKAEEDAPAMLNGSTTKKDAAPDPGHKLWRDADIQQGDVAKPAEPVPEVETTARPSEAGWTRYVTEEAEYWWHCTSTDEWFMEKEPGQWSEFMDTATNKKYWFHPDGRCFWAEV